METIKLKHCDFKCKPITDLQVTRLLNRDNTHIHEISQIKTQFGEFTSLIIETNSNYFRLCGYGFHEQRDRYFIDDWRIRQTTSVPVNPKNVLLKGDVLSKLEKLKYTQELMNSRHIQSEDGKYFEGFADSNNDEYAIEKVKEFDI